MYCITRAFEKHRQLSFCNRCCCWVLGEGEKSTKAIAFESSRDEVEPDGVTRDDANLFEVAFHEYDTVTGVGVGSQHSGSSEQPVKSTTEIDAMLGKKDPLDRDGQHASTSVLTRSVEANANDPALKLKLEIEVRRCARR